tara:strand:+ start:393 stop:977 length:585 start_codon:yes stop_codon:yes gene_type:complete
VAVSAFSLPYSRSAAVAALLVAGAWLGLSDWRLQAWQELLPLFEWMETTPLGVAGKTWGAVFALVQALHLLSMALLGGAVLVADARLLGLLLREVPLATVQQRCHRVFAWALLVVVCSGVFMACGVAVKVYYLPVFWYKMLALAVGVVFVYLVRRPLLRHADAVHPWTLRLVALASLMIWFSVAATGRWIGFSG